MMIRKFRLSLAEIQAFIDCWGWLLVGDLKNSGQADAYHVDQLLEVRKNSFAAEKA